MHVHVRVVSTRYMHGTLLYWKYWHCLWALHSTHTLYYTHTHTQSLLFTEQLTHAHNRIDYLIHYSFECYSFLFLSLCLICSTLPLLACVYLSSFTLSVMRSLVCNILIYHLPTLSLSLSFTLSFSLSLSFCFVMQCTQCIYMYLNLLPCNPLYFSSFSFLSLPPLLSTLS